MNPLKDLYYKNLSSAKFELREVHLLENPIEKKERRMGEKKGTLQQTREKGEGQGETTHIHNQKKGGNVNHSGYS